MKKNNFKHIYFILTVLVGTLAISSIANAFSLWFFANSSSVSDSFTSSVLADDIKENYNLKLGTTANEDVIKVGSHKDITESKYTYKLLGGYSSNSTTDNRYDFNNKNVYTFTEINFNTSYSINPNYNTYWWQQGRLFYSDMVYFGSRSDKYTTDTPLMKGTLSSTSSLTTTLNEFQLTLKQSGFSIARSSDDDPYYDDDGKIDIDNLINVIDQDGYFCDVEYSSYSKSKAAYKWLKKAMIDRINNECENDRLDYYFDECYTEKENKDDNISRFNGETKSKGNYYLSKDYQNVVTDNDYNNIIKPALRRKFFSNDESKNSYDYYNVLLFIPFKKVYSEHESESDETIINNDNSYNTNAGKLDENYSWESPLDEDFGFVSLVPATKTSSLESYLKIIDFTDIYGFKTVTSDSSLISLPTVLNGGIKLDSDNYVSLKDNFIDNGNLFVNDNDFDDTGGFNDDLDLLSDIENSDKVTGYRRVYGFSNNYEKKTYEEPTYSGSINQDYHIGSFITNVYYNYNQGVYKNYYGNGPYYKDTVINENKSLSSISLSDLLKGESENGNEYKLIDHLTLEEVKVTQKTYLDSDGNEKTSDEYGFYFNKSMILYLIRDEIEVKNLIIDSASASIRL